VIFCGADKLTAENADGPNWPGSPNTLAITARLIGPRFLKGNEQSMLCAAFDILRKDSTDMVWVEAVHDLETARSRVQELVAGSNEEYVIFDQRTRKIIASGPAPKPRR
jgi:hypothetical protein